MNNQRERLHRGKRKDGGGWREGYYAKIGDLDVIIGLDGQYHGVIPETVGEYATLTDKNGKRIFEGDIVHVRDEIDGSEFNGYVDYADGSFYISGWFAHYRWMDYEVTVIGNVHDNPELLEGGTNHERD